MKFYDVYPLYEIEPVKGNGCRLYDVNGTEYLDFFGGHGVISVGHGHPHFLEKIHKQINELLFYSNSFRSSLKDEIASKLGNLSGYNHFGLFLCNSGAEAVENAIKVASFYNGRKKILAVRNAFHGRTAAAIAVTDNPEMRAPVNNSVKAGFVLINDVAEFKMRAETKEYCTVIIEGIQGVGGINIPEEKYLKSMREICTETDTVLIVDEIQSGYGRSGKFFAHQYSGIEPDIITIAKGMANGIPAGGVLISPKFRAKHGMLGSTFGGNQLVCAGGIAVLEIIEKENLTENARITGDFLINGLKKFSSIKEVRGRGLMIGIEFDFTASEIRNKLLNDFRILTGSSGTNIIRLLPPLTLNMKDAEYFLTSLKECLQFSPKTD